MKSMTLWKGIAMNEEMTAEAVLTTDPWCEWEDDDLGEPMASLCGVNKCFTPDDISKRGGGFIGLLRATWPRVLTWKLPE